jgi:hypothetical protein
MALERAAHHRDTAPHQDLLFALFLPGLLFEAACHTETDELRDNAWTIGALAVTSSDDRGASRSTTLTRCRLGPSGGQSCQQ